MISSQLSNYVSFKIWSISWLQAASIRVLVFLPSCCFVNFITSSASDLLGISRKRLSYLCSVPSLVVHSQEKWNVRREINVTVDYFLNFSRNMMFASALAEKKNNVFAYSSRVTSLNFPVNRTTSHSKKTSLEGPLIYRLEANSILDIPCLC